MADVVGMNGLGRGKAGQTDEGRKGSARQESGREQAQRTLTVLATGLHQKMRACSGEVCLELLILLSEGERSVGMLARMLLLDLPAVSGRLATLKNNGLVVLVRKDGNRRIYALSSLVRVGMRAGKRVIRLRASGGGELKIVVSLESMATIAAGWTEVERAEREEGSMGVLVRPVTVREIAAKARRRK